MRLGRWLIAIGMGILVAVVVAVAIKSTTSGSGNAYMVRAIFDNSSFMIAGEDVKIAGVKVGTVSAVQLTPQNKAALVLQINAPQYAPFRTDAHCEIGLESLLGEQFVQCTPTQPRAPEPLRLRRSRRSRPARTRENTSCRSRTRHRRSAST